MTDEYLPDDYTPNPEQVKAAEKAFNKAAIAHDALCDAKRARDKAEKS